MTIEQIATTYSGVATAVVAVLVMVIGEFRRRRGHTIAEARKGALGEQEVSTIEKSLGRLATSLELMATRQNAHEIECAAFRAGIETEIRLTREANERTGRRLDDLTSQFSRLMPAANTFVEVLPNGRRRSRKGVAAGKN